MSSVSLLVKHFLPTPTSLSRSSAYILIKRQIRPFSKSPFLSQPQRFFLGRSCVSMATYFNLFFKVFFWFWNQGQKHERKKSWQGTFKKFSQVFLSLSFYLSVFTSLFPSLSLSLFPSFSPSLSLSFSILYIPNSLSRKLSRAFRAKLNYLCKYLLFQNTNIYYPYILCTLDSPM